MKYSTIANNTFSYLLTVDEFRNGIEESVRPSWIKITTITMISKFSKEVDIPKLRELFENNKTLKIKNKNSNDEYAFEWKLKPTTFYNQVTLTYDDLYSTKSIKVFPNGSIQVAGCSDLYDCKRIIGQLSYIFKHYLHFEEDIPVDSFRVVMINSNFSLNYNLNLMKVAQHFENTNGLFKVSFEPDRYSAVKVKFRPAEDMKEVTCSMFSTGKIIITGAETLKEIAFAYNIINHHINQNNDIRVSKTKDVDVFDIFLGYKCEDFVEYIQSMGYNSWTKTTANNKINF